ncbi:modin [Colletotrichum sp. SAR11_239]|nr:modin [Colletotrichum sp. SAR11_239]
MRRSFDTNPNIKKPYATTTISHIIELASTLGLYWKVFDRDDNKYRAEGNGYSLTGSRIADFGIVFSFEKIGPPAFQERRVIPTYEVKELCFGRVPTLFRGPKETEDTVEWLKPLKTSTPDSLEILQLGSREEIAETLTQIGCNVNTILLYKEEKNDKHLFSVTFEMMGMLARVFHIKDRCFRFLPNPTIFPWTKDSFSLLRLLIAFDSQLERDLLDIHQMMAEEFEEDDDIDVDVRAELKQIRELAQIAQKLSDDFKYGAKLTYFRMNDLHEAILWTDEVLKGKDHLVVRDVLRRHLQEVLAAKDVQVPKSELIGNRQPVFIMRPRSRAYFVMGSREQPAALLEGRRIYLGNLLYVVRPVEIEDTLKDNDFGNFEKIVISVDPVNGRNPGYCFVDFVERVDAERALSSLCVDIRGRPVKVGPCEPKKQRQRVWGREAEPNDKRWGNWTGQQEPGAEGTGDSPYEAMGHFDKVVGTDGDGRRLYIGGLTRMIDQQQAQEEMRDILAGFNP